MDKNGILILLGFASLVVYFWPTIIAHYRNHPSAPAISILNLLLGWTLIGWVVAMVWAAQAIDVPVGDQQGPAKNKEAGSVKQCPYCAEDIKPEARVCRYCGRDLV